MQDTEPTEQPSGSAVHGAEPPSLWGFSGHNFIKGYSAQNVGGSGGMAIFLTAAVAFAATRAAGRVGQLCRGPWNPEGAPSSLAIEGPASVHNFWLLHKTRAPIQ